VELVDGVAVVDNFEAAHHVAGNAGFLFVSDLLPHWVVLPALLPQLEVVVALGLQSALYCLYVVLAVGTCPWSLQGHLLGVDLAHLAHGCFFLQHLREIGN
jgi:hypothetical protein